MRLFFEAVDIALGIYIWPVFAAAVIVWLKGFNLVSFDTGALAVVDRFLANATAPFLAPMRYIAPPRNEVDVSPLFLILILMSIRYLISIYLLPAYS